MKDKRRSRLARLQRSGELAPARPSKSPPKKSVPGECFLFPGEESVAQTATGNCYLREVSVPLQQRHGCYTLAEGLNCNGSDLSLPARDRSLSPVDPERCLFLDVETTGLSGGTGTWVFLIGLGWQEGDFFRIRQYFLRHPAEEAAMLHHFAEFAASFSRLVTFNGKAFDLPLIQTRQTLQRVPQTAPHEHLDLLTCARSLWRERFPSRSLDFLEEALLGFQRCDDIPGWEIPAVYFNYLRRSDVGALLKVFEHNLFDILSMAVLLGRVAATVTAEEPAHPAECYSLGRLYHEAGETKKAELYYRQVGDSGKLAQAALSRLAMLYKKQGEWPRALSLWEKLARDNPSAAVEMAKYYEHQARDFQAALHWSNRALREAQRRSGIPFSNPDHPAALRHRINRLQRKIGHCQKAPSSNSAE